MPTGLALNSVSIQRNKYYRLDGTKSYVFLMEKWGFDPSLGGKYFQGTKMQQQGKYAGVGGRAVGGRLRKARVVKKRTGPNDADAVDVTADDIQNDSQYNAEVWIGTPPQKFFLDLDTASADTWVWSATLPAEILHQAGSKHSIFDPSKSSTYKDVEGSTWEIRFGSHVYASGKVATDTVAIGQLNLFDQMIQLPTYISPEFVRGSGLTDGTLGLAWGRVSSVEPEPPAAPIETMMIKEQTQIHESQRLFTMKLGSWRGSDELDHDQGFFTFGYIDFDLVKESNMVLHYVDVDNSNGLWEFESGSFAVNGEVIKRENTSNTAIVDTGTPLVLLDDACVKAIYDKIPGARYDPEAMGYVIPADIQEEALPSIGLEVKGKIFAIEKEDLGFSIFRDGWVYGGIQSRGNLPFDLFGECFLKSVYAIFELGRHDEPKMARRFGVTARPNLKSQVQLAPGGELRKTSFFHRIIHRINHGQTQEPTNVADKPTV